MIYDGLVRNNIFRLFFVRFTEYFKRWNEKSIRVEDGGKGYGMLFFSYDLEIFIMKL